MIYSDQFVAMSEHAQWLINMLSTFAKYNNTHQQCATDKAYILITEIRL